MTTRHAHLNAYNVTQVHPYCRCEETHACRHISRAGRAGSTRHPHVDTDRMLDNRDAGPLEAPVDRSGRWNDTDSRLTAEALIKDALDRPWSQRFTQVVGRKPVVVVGTVLNSTLSSSIPRPS